MPQPDSSICLEQQQPDPRYMLEPESMQGIDAETVDDDIALKIITDNYAICQVNRDQLIGLQGWIKSQSKP